MQKGTIEPIATASPIHQFVAARQYCSSGIKRSIARNFVPANATMHDEQPPTSSSQLTSLIDRSRQSIFTPQRRIIAAAPYTTTNSTFPTRKEYVLTGK